MLNIVNYNSDPNKTVNLKSHTSLKSILKSSSTFREKMECIWLSLCFHLSADSKVRKTASRRLETQLANFSLRKEFNSMHKGNQIQWNVSVIKADRVVPTLSEKMPQGKKCEVKFVPTTTLIAAQDLLEDDLGNPKEGIFKEDIVILDIASAINPGGAFVLPQKGTQEESICEHTDLYSALKYAKSQHDKSTSKQKNFIPEDGCLFIPNVPLVRDAKKDILLNMSSSINVVAAAALDFRKSEIKKSFGEKVDEVVNGKVITKYQMNDAGKAATKDIMRAILEACKQNDKKHLVLGALGCGAYKNRPEQIAQLWKEVIEEYETEFISITFAIYANPNKPRDMRNFSVFKDTFGVNDL